MRLKDLNEARLPPLDFFVRNNLDIDDFLYQLANPSKDLFITFERIRRKIYMAPDLFANWNKFKLICNAHKDTLVKLMLTGFRDHAADRYELDCVYAMVITLIEANLGWPELQLIMKSLQAQVNKLDAEMDY